MAASYQKRFILRAVVLAFTCIAFAGCQSLEFDAGNNQTIGEPVAEADVIGQYQMQLIPGWGAPSVEKVNITGPLTVQDALEASGAIKKFGRMKISLGRIIKGKGELLKLPVEYQFREKSIRPEQNYEVLPGDTITVSPAKSDKIQKLLRSATGGVI